MFDKGLQIMLILKGLERKIKAAQADGETTFEEKRDLLVAALSSVIDIALAFVGADVVDAALAKLMRWRTETEMARERAAVVLDEIGASADQILNR